MEDFVAADYEKLKKTRIYLKSQITRGINGLKELLEKGCTDNVEINRRISMMEGRINNFQEILNQMEKILSCNDLIYNKEGNMTEWARDLETQSEELDSRAVILSSLRSEFLGKHTPTDSTKDEEMLKLIEKLSTKLDDIRIAEKSRPAIRIPGLHAPCWDGAPRNFQSWRVRMDQYFESAGMTDGKEKLMILLNGNALPKVVQDTIVDCSSVDGENGAWRRLEEKVPTSAIIRDVLLGLEALKPMKSTAAREMRQVLDGLTDFARRMRELGQERELDSFMTIEIASRKIDSGIYYEYMRQSKCHNQTLAELITYLRRETEARERREHPHSLSDNTNKSAVNYFRDKSSECDESLATLVDDGRACPFCIDKTHLIIKCPIFISKTKEERRRMIVSSKRCFFCLRANHNAINCTRPDKKRCVDCQLYHHRFVACPPYGNKVQPRTFSGLESSRAGGTSTLNANLTLSGSASECNIGRAREVASDADATFNTVGTLNSSQEGKIHRRYSPTTYVELQDVEKKWHRVVAFIDTGADTTLLKLSTAKHFGLQGEPFKFRYGVAGGGIAEESSAKFSIQIRPVNGIKSYNVIAIGIEKPAHNSPAVGGDIFDEYPHLNAAKGTLPTDEAEIDIIIGYDYYFLTMPVESVKDSVSPESSPVAVRSILGWTIFGGNIPKPKPHAASRVQFLSHLEDLQKLYTSDVVGVKPTTLCVCSDKEIAESQFIKHCRNKLCINADGRMTVEMPWKPGFPEALECNKPQAEIRLMSQEKRLIKNGTFDEYSEEIQKLIDSCFVRELYPEESRDEGWYLQHHAVYQLHKSTKVRIVWNSAAKFNGLCLNDGFYKGPDFLNSLLYCLLHWRMKSIGIAGDVQKMFNQILMAEKDQRYHRFVWRFDLSSPIRHWQWLRLPFGDKPAPDIAMMAVRTLADTFKEEEPIGAQLINCRMYMDDVIESFDKSELAIAAMDQVDRILGKGSFRIKEWHSNDPSVDRCPEDKQTRVLGHVWDKATDSVAIQLDKFSEEFSKLTKRKVASLVSKLWDPTGMLSPVIIRYKICLQDLWASGVGWDDELSEEQIKMWKGYVHEMNQLIGFRLDRMIKPEDSLGDPQLHGFSDASESALGSVIWLKWNTSHGVELKFVIAKSLVAPLKQRSIPRLELTAAVVMARLALLVLQVVGRVSTMKFWTDSEVVLAWVRSPARTFKPFVSARVQEIQDALPGFSKEFCYVPSQLNPADALTKPIKPSELQGWINGPDFLLNSSQDCDFGEPTYDFEKKRCIVKEYTPESLKRIQFVGILADESFEERFTELSSDWNRLVRITAYCRRLLLQQNPENYQSHLEPKEIQEAELALFYASQKSLNNQDEVNHKQIKKLDPKLDEKGILRIGGRLHKLHLPYEQRHPVLLVRNSSLAEAFAQMIHRCTGHQGYRVAIALAFKRGVYIIGGARLFKDIAFKCCFCRTRRRLLLGQQMGELPSFRGEPNTPPFSRVALDFFGPIKIKLTRNASTEGSIMIITCTVTRVISLELVDSLSSDAFLCAWRRFTCNHGIHPVLAVSDRGRNFIGAQEKLQKWINSWNESLIKDKFAIAGTKFEWKFNTPHASHMNGVVESLIRSCRRGLDAVADYHHKKFSALEWQTILSEVTYLVNSRPLFPNGPDPLESPTITGNDLLFPHGQPSVLQPYTGNEVNLRSMVEVAQQRIQIFWETWIRYMPPQLVQRSKWFHPKQNLQVGDLVLLLEPGLKGGVAPRGLWRRGLVERIHPGKDGLVRRVTVRTVENGKVVHWERPIHKLCLIATVQELQHGFQAKADKDAQN